MSLLLVGLAAISACALVASGARSAGTAQGLIAFARDDGVYATREDGSGVRLLWQGAYPKDLSWSPDGSKLAVSTGGRSVWVLNADSSDPVRIARVGASSLSWSPDGRKIAFTRWYNAKNPDVWVMNADGSNMHRLKRTPQLYERSVDWKPTGGWLAFDSGGWVPEIYVMRTDGTHLLTLTVASPFWSWSEQPDWSPDGRRLAFTWARPFEESSLVISDANSEICVMNASGKGSRTLLTKNRVYDGSPSWSPDGRKIAFVRNRTDIYVMNADGTRPRRLAQGGSPIWQPVAAP